jgi:hypothetical protein
VPPKRPLTVVELLTVRLGPWKASQALIFITAWWTEEELRGRRLRSPDELVQAHWFSKAAAYRKQILFREAFAPEGLADPHELAELLPDGIKSAVQVARMKAS